MNFIKDAGHLLRFAGLFVIAFLLFWAIRGYVVPKTFGQYGHYRGAAIAEIAAHPVKYAGHATCETCHSDVVDVKTKGKHAHVNCEACHGPQAAHAGDPGSVTPAKLDTGTLCVRCHAASGARPRDFPQVEAEEHSSGVSCETCHQPHNPAIDGSAATPDKAAPDKTPARAAGGAK
jgi:Cytochrome c554 and c-prime